MVKQERRNMKENMKKTLRTVIVLGCLVGGSFPLGAEVLFEEAFYIDESIRLANTPISGAIVGSTKGGLEPTGYEWEQAAFPTGQNMRFYKPGDEKVGDGLLNIGDQPGTSGVAMVEVDDLGLYTKLRLELVGSSHDSEALEFGFSSSRVDRNFAEESRDALFIRSLDNGNVELVAVEGGKEEVLDTLLEVNRMGNNDKFLLEYDVKTQTVGGAFIQEGKHAEIPFKAQRIDFRPDLRNVKIVIVNESGENANFPRVESVVLSGER